MQILPLSGALLLLVSSAILSWWVGNRVLRLAWNRRMIDVPNERSSHDEPTPRGGGLGIFLVINTAGLIWLIVKLGGGQTQLLSSTRLVLLLVSGLFIGGISWIEDIRRDIRPELRLAIHFAGAGIAMIAIGYWTRAELPIVGGVSWGWLGLFLTAVWIAGLVNAYNFMDGIDGIAGGQALTASAGWIALGIFSGVEGMNCIIGIAVLVCGSVLGFLFHNWPPAKIFMGDIGSAFLGYCFAVLPLVAGRFVTPPLKDRLPVVGILFVAPFLIDVSFTIGRRFLRREKLSQAHRTHFYQRLVILGLSHRKVAGLYMSLGIMGSTVGLIYAFSPARWIAERTALASIVLIWLIPFAWVIILAHRKRKKEKGQG